MTVMDEEVRLRRLADLRQRKLEAEEEFRAELLACFDVGIPSQRMAIALGTTRQNVDNILGKLSLRRGREQRRKAE